jgi:preprotein translocase subunit SecA
VQIQRQDEAELIERQRREAAEREKMAFQHAQASGLADPGEQGETPEQEAPAAPQPFTREQPKVGRNEPCPCGSGKKYKQCHGKL